MKLVSGIKNIAQTVINGDVRRGTVHTIDFDKISVVMENSTTVIHNVEVVGNPEKLKPGDTVTVVVVKRRPIAVTSDAAQLLAEVAPHAETHLKDGIDPITPEGIGAAATDHTHEKPSSDAAADIPSMRSLGVGAQQAAPGNHNHTGLMPGVHAATHLAGGSDPITWASVSHSSIGDLDHDDHTQYLTNARHDLTARHGSSVVDHGSIGGLGDDDHTQYALVSGARNLTRATLNGTNASGVYSLDVLGASGADRTILRVGQTGYSNGFVITYTNATPKLTYVFNGGSVGIGGTPAYPLDVVGIIHSTGLMVGTKTLTLTGNLTASADATVSGTNTGDQIVPANTSATANQFFTAYDNTTGAFTKARPTWADVDKTTSSLADLTTKAHSALTGLTTGDDHTQYLNTTRHDATARHTLGTVVPHDAHSALTGLTTGDDHTQYLNTTRHDVTARHTLGTVVPHDALSALTDATITTPASTHLLQYNGTKWVNVTLASIDHGSLGGQGDDDHAQYLNTTRHDTTARHTLGTVVPHDAHSALTGLTVGDDHTQYLNTTRHDVTARHTLGTVVPHDVHSALSGLTNDDHTQYLLANGTRTLSGSLTITGNILPNVTDASDVGSSSKLVHKIWASEIDAVTFSQSTVQLYGGWLMIAKGEASINTDMTTVSTTVDFGQAMTPNDIVLFRGPAKEEYMQVGTLVSGTTYNVTRNLDASGADAWTIGTPCAILGQSTGGRIELNAKDTPRLSLFKRTGALWNSNAEIARFGDINGLGGVVTETYGIFIGDATNYLKYDGTTLTVAGNGSGLTSITGGNITSGTVTATQIAANTITGDRINLNTLIAIKSNTFGTDGIQFDYNAGNPRAYIGDGTSNYLKFDGTTLTISGNGSGLTSISGSNISTGTINASVVSVTNISASNITTGTLSASLISAGTITADKLATGVLGVSKTITLGQVANSTGRIELSTDGSNLATIKGIYRDSGGVDTTQAYFGSDGKFYGGNGAVSIDSLGISVLQPTNQVDTNAYKFKLANGTTTGGMYSWYDSFLAINSTGISTYAAGMKTSTTLKASADAGYSASCALYADYNTGAITSSITVGANNIVGSIIYLTAANVTVYGKLGIDNSTKVDLLNSDLLDGYHVSFGAGGIPVNNGGVMGSLNADMTDGLHALTNGASAHLVATDANGSTTFTRLTASKELTSSDGTAGQLYIQSPAANDVNGFAEIAMGGRRANVTHPIFLIRSKFNNNGGWADRQLTITAQAYAGAAQTEVFKLDEWGNVVIQGSLTSTIGLVACGTAFPASKVNGMQFYRTDIGMLCVWNGTYWLTVAEYSFSWARNVSAISASVGLASYPLRQDYQAYFTRVVGNIDVITTNNSTNYWSVDVRAINQPYNGSDGLSHNDTKTNTVGADTHFVYAMNRVSSLNPAVRCDIYLTKNGTPGNITSVEVTLYYKYVIV